jgi:hypothetical protein
MLGLRQEKREEKELTVLQAAWSRIIQGHHYTLQELFGDSCELVAGRTGVSMRACAFDGENGDKKAEQIPCYV